MFQLQVDNQHVEKLVTYWLLFQYIAAACVLIYHKRYILTKFPSCELDNKDELLCHLSHYPMAVQPAEDKQMLSSGYINIW